jgi:hypothetical protein
MDGDMLIEQSKQQSGKKGGELVSFLPKTLIRPAFPLKKEVTKVWN